MQGYSMTQMNQRKYNGDKANKLLVTNSSPFLKVEEENVRKKKVNRKFGVEIFPYRPCIS